MSPGQCRAARERLKWSQADLALAAQVPIEVVVNFEGARASANSGFPSEVRDALESVGIGFPFLLENGRATPARITYSPRESGELH